LEPAVLHAGMAGPNQAGSSPKSVMFIGQTIDAFQQEFVKNVRFCCPSRSHWYKGLANQLPRMRQR
jgi:hypothetical protein